MTRRGTWKHNATKLTTYRPSVAHEIPPTPRLPKTSKTTNHSNQSRQELNLLANLNRHRQSSDEQGETSPTPENHWHIRILSRRTDFRLTVQILRVERFFEPRG
jgi:hypothetical protein